MVVRRMELSDVEAVYQLSCENFSEPWSFTSIEKEVSNSVATYFVADLKGEIVGFGGIWHVLDEGEIINIAVAKKYQRTGIGRTLLNQMMTCAQKKKLSVIHLEVRASNEGAKCLYTAQGFKQIAIRKAYYHNPSEDAIIMEWRAEDML